MFEDFNTKKYRSLSPLEEFRFKERLNATKQQY